MDASLPQPQPIFLPRAPKLYSIESIMDPKYPLKEKIRRIDRNKYRLTYYRLGDRTPVPWLYLTREQKSISLFVFDPALSRLLDLRANFLMRHSCPEDLSGRYYRLDLCGAIRYRMALLQNWINNGAVDEIQVCLVYINTKKLLPNKYALVYIEI